MPRCAVRFKTPLRPLAAGLIPLLASGCLGLDTGPTFSLLQSVVSEGEALPEFSRAAGGTAALTVSGQIVGKLPCDEVRGEIKDNGGDIEFTVTMISDRQFCNGRTPTTFSWIANVLNLDSGQQPVRVRYRYQGTDGIPGVVLDTVVAVGS